MPVVPKSEGCGNRSEDCRRRLVTVKVHQIPPARLLLVAGPQMLHRSELVDHLPYRFQTVGNRSHRTHLPALCGDRHRDRLRMDIETDKQYLRHERPVPFVCGSAPLDSPLRSVTRDNCEQAAGRSILTRETGGGGWLARILKPRAFQPEALAAATLCR